MSCERFVSVSNELIVERLGNDILPPNSEIVSAARRSTSGFLEIVFFCPDLEYNRSEGEDAMIYEGKDGPS